MRKGILFVVLWASGLSGAQAGVVIGGTRVVYHEQQNSVTLSLRNNSHVAWLIHSKLLPGANWKGAVEPAGKAPFLITPPLFSLKAGRESALRILYTGAGLPGDRESLFTLSIATIPSGKVNENSVQLAVRSRLKFIFRPANLPGSAQDAYRSLRWSRSGHQLSVDNPTPYYVTLFNMTVCGNVVRNPGVVAPFSQRKIEELRTAAHCSLQWQGVNDFGRVMPVQTAQLAGEG